MRLRKFFKRKLPTLLKPLSALLNDGVDSEAVELHHSGALRPAVNAYGHRRLVDVVGGEDGLELLDELGGDLLDPGGGVVAIQGVLRELRAR